MQNCWGERKYTCWRKYQERDKGEGSVGVDAGRRREIEPKSMRETEG